MAAEARDVEMSLMVDELDEKVMMALGDLSVRTGVLDEECAASGMPAYVGDYLMAAYGDDELGIREAADVLRISGLVDEGRPPAGRDVVCRVSGARRVDGDVYALFTPCPLLHKLGIEGSAVRAKGLLDGAWCHLVVNKHILDGCEYDDVLDEDALDDDTLDEDDTTDELELVRIPMANYSIDDLHVVRGNASAVSSLLDLRAHLSADEWGLLLLRSYGLDGERTDAEERLRLLARFAPLAQSGLRALFVRSGEWSKPCEVSPYEGSVDHLQTECDGFPGSWDCVVTSDEVGRGACALVSMLDGCEGIATGVSLAVVSDGEDAHLRRVDRLYGPFHLVVQVPDVNTAGLDAIDAESSHLGVDRCLLGELWHALRVCDLSREFDRAFKGVAGRLTQGYESVRLAFEGMAKVMFPHGRMTKEEGEELLEFVLETSARASL